MLVDGGLRHRRPQQRDDEARSHDANIDATLIAKLEGGSSRACNANCHRHYEHPPPGHGNLSPPIAFLTSATTTGQRISHPALTPQNLDDVVFFRGQWAGNSSHTSLDCLRTSFQDCDHVAFEVLPIHYQAIAYFSPLSVSLFLVWF
jgi:hypothetical protein